MERVELGEEVAGRRFLGIGEGAKSARVIEMGVMEEARGWLWI